MAPYLSIIIPVYNEESNVEILFNEINNALKLMNKTYEIIFIDDGSSDSTYRILATMKEKYKGDSSEELRIIKLFRNFGQTTAMQAGFDHARGGIIVSLDGDLQNDPGDIPRLLAKLEEGYDVVCGWRKDRKDKALTRIFPSKVANWLISKVTGVRIHDNGCSLKVYKSSVIKSLRLYSDMHRFIPAISTMVGARVAEIVVNHRPRIYGETKYGLSRIWKVLFDILTIKMLIHFYHRPIVWFGSFSFIFLFVGFIVGVISISHLFMGEEAIVYLTICILMLFTFGNLLSWGILSDLALNIEKRSWSKKNDIYGDY